MTRVSSAASRLVGAYQEDLLSLDELRARMPELRKRQSTLQAQLDALESQQVDREGYFALAENLESFLARLCDSAETAPNEDRQRILRLIVRDVLVGPDQVGCRVRAVRRCGRVRRFAGRLEPSSRRRGRRG